MKGFLKIVLILATIVLASACLAPLFYKFLPYKFERIFNRLVMIFSLAALVFSLKKRRIALADYGLPWHRQSVSYLRAGFLTGLGALAVFSLVKVATGQAVLMAPQGAFSVWALRFLSALGAAFLIAFIEEFFFRGFVYRSLTQSMRLSALWAYGITSVFYSLVHFVSFEKPYVDTTPNFLDGLRVAGAPLLSLLQLGRYWPEALGLFIFGLVLNRAVVQAGSLYPAIGLHAGCVFYVKTDGLFLSFADHHRLLYASGKFYDGFLGWGFLILIGFFLSAAIGRIQGGKGQVRHA